MPEQWKQIVEYPDVYEVSNLGNVRRVGKAKGTYAGRILKPRTSPKLGYPYVNLWSKNKGKTFFVHRLVASAFIGPIHSGKVVNHKDGIRTNNNLENLEIITHRENLLHGYNQLGSTRGPIHPLKGENSPRAKISESTVISIRNRHNSGASFAELARQYNLSESQVTRIAKRQSWVHVL